MKNKSSEDQFELCQEGRARKDDTQNSGMQKASLEHSASVDMVFNDAGSYNGVRPGTD